MSTAATERPRRRAPKAPITVDRIVETAFAIIRAEGFPALTMRRVAAALDTGPASLYAHVRNKAALDDRLIAELSSAIELPAPDAERWQEQFLAVCSALRDRFLDYPGVSGAVFETSPTSLEALRISEGMLGILLAGGVPPRPAAWAIDAALLYVAAYCLEASARDAGPADAVARADAARRLRELPPERFPHTLRHAGEITGGEGHERFDFTLITLMRGLPVR